MILLQVADPYVAPVLVGLVMAFVTQGVAVWMRGAKLETKVTRICEDMKELQELHPRQSNPGHRSHLEGAEHAEER